MQNWSGDENEAMKGYIMVAVKRMNADSRAEYGINEIDERTLDLLFDYLHCVCDDLTADEAQAFYLHHSNTETCE